MNYSQVWDFSYMDDPKERIEKNMNKTASLAVEMVGESFEVDNFNFSRTNSYITH